MASSSSVIMASSSSMSRNWIYDVFPSFRGEDVRGGILSHIRKEFRSKGIKTFIDDEIKRGESIDPALKLAIRKSRVAIVLLSSNYASSSWCLDELVEIMKCKEEDQQTVMAIFYEVDPSHVRKQTGDFGKAFENTCVGRTEKVKQAWRKALEVVGNIAGYHSRNWNNEAALIEKIASDVNGVLGITPSRDFDDFIGMESRVMEINSLLNLQSNGVRMVGIWGPAGIGKTSTARVLYNQLSPRFSFSTFIENIKGIYSRPCYDEYPLRLSLQKQLLSKIFKQQDIEVGHLGVAQERLRDKKVLVVLDEVDSLWQLIAMANKPEWFGPGSIIIITTEDRKILDAHKIKYIHEMTFPSHYEALQIFCLYAFGKKFPDDGFEKLAWEVTGLAGHLPLGLEVMGSYLKGMSMEKWRDALPRLRSSLHGEIESTLRFSYDVLSVKDKLLFLYIACFFVGWKVDLFKRCLANSGLDVNHGFDNLTQKSLISTYSGEYLGMNRLLRQMGRDIVYKQSTDNPGKRQFLMDTTEICDLLDENTVSETVIGITLNPPHGEEIELTKNAFEGMKNLQFLAVYSESLCLPEGLNCLPNKLRFISWDHCPLRFWPCKFSGKFLIELCMIGSKIEKLWEGIKPLQCLKRMDLSHSQDLKEIPDLTKATSLEELDLGFCSGLLELTNTIGNATKLKRLKLRDCKSLKELPFSIGNCTNLQLVVLSLCTSLTELPSSIGRLINLEKLKLSGCTSLAELPSSIGSLINLKKLELSCCTSLEELPSSIGSLINLEKLELSGCTSLEELPSSIGSLINLEKLELSGCTSLEELPSSIGSLINLEELGLRQCVNSVMLPSIENLHKLPFLNMSFCNKLEVFLANNKLGSLSEFNLWGCTLLRTFPDISTNVKNLDLRYTAIDEVPSSISSWSSLKIFDMIGCRNLEEFPNVPESIVELRLSFTGIEEIPPGIENLFHLRKLIMYGCKKLKNMSPNISKLQNLEFLGLSNGNYGDEDADDDDGDEDDIYDPFDDDGHEYDNCYEAVIKWGPDLMRSWTLRSDFKGDYILPICLPEKALTSPISLSFHDYGFEAIPDCIRHLSGLSKLDIRKCSWLKALPQLPGSLLSLDAAQCCSLSRIDCSFQNPEIRLNFAGCISLNEEARELIQKSSCKYAILPGVRVPEHFTHQDTSGSLTINLTPRPLPSFFKFKACILLSKDDYEEYSMCVSWHVSGKPNGIIVEYGSNELQIQTPLLPPLYGGKRLFIFEDSFSLKQDCLEAKEATFISDLVFEFIVHNNCLKVEGCGVRLLEIPHSTLDGKQTEEEHCMDRSIEANSETEVGEESSDDDPDTRRGKRVRLSFVSDL